MSQTWDEFMAAQPDGQVCRDAQLVYVSRRRSGMSLGDVRRFVAEMDAAALPDSHPVSAVIYGSEACGTLRELRGLR